MVVIFRSPIEPIGSRHERTGSPSICTVQAPHCAIPQPNFVPVSPITSRNAHRSGVSAATSKVCRCPLTSIVIDILASHSRSATKRKHSSLANASTQRLRRTNRPCARRLVPRTSSISLRGHRSLHKHLVAHQQRLLGQRTGRKCCEQQHFWQRAAQTDSSGRSTARPDRCTEKCPQARCRANAPSAACQACPSPEAIRSFARTDRYPHRVLKPSSPNRASARMASSLTSAAYRKTLLPL